MALKSNTWFLSCAYDEEKTGSQLSQLSAQAMKLGLKGEHGTRGHVLQSVGAAQRFFEAYPQHLAVVAASSGSDPFKPTGQILSDWLAFITLASGPYGRGDFGYDYTTLKGILTGKYGGTRTGGGGGDNEFEIVLRLVAAFV